MSSRNFLNSLKKVEIILFNLMNFQKCLCLLSN